MRILVFSDIHNDVKALGRLLDIEADYYFAAGDVETFVAAVLELAGNGAEAVDMLRRSPTRTWPHEQERPPRLGANLPDGGRPTPATGPRSARSTRP